MGAAAASREAVEGIEDDAVERHKADQQKIGKGDPGEIDRQREPARVFADSRREQIDHQGREQQGRAEQYDLVASSSMNTRSLNSRTASVPLATRTRA